MEEIGKLGGGYNPLLQTSLPEKFRSYNPDKETSESSHRAFTTTFPRGFALEVLQVYSGPPVIVYKFRHWGYMEGPFKGHAPTGDIVEFYGMAIFEVALELLCSRLCCCLYFLWSNSFFFSKQVDEQMKVIKVEFFYDPGELLGGLLKGASLDGSAEELGTGCPVLRNTG